jgi:hypothetical protein
MIILWIFDKEIYVSYIIPNLVSVATPLWGKCEVATHTPENGTWKSSETPKNSEFDCRGQNTSSWGILYTVGKVLKCKCPK